MAARRDDIGEIRRLLEAIRDAKAKRAYAEQELGRKTAAHERQQHDADTAAARLTAARAEATETLTAWSARWSPPSDAPRPTDAPRPSDEASLPVDGSELPDHLITTADIDALTEVLERTGEPGAASLAEAYDRCTADRQAATITAQANLGAALREARRRLTDLRAERDAIAAEQDDAPPASDLRPATRDARPGAPLWQLVRFAPDVPDETAAAIEGALYGAGLLTAWVHPDPALTRTALDAAEADGYLIPAASGSAPGASPGAASGGAKTLADVLIAEDQEHVPADVIVAVLRSITLTDDIMASGSDIPARPVSRGVDYVFGYAPEAKAARSVASASQPLVSTKAQFSYGVHVGARPKQVPEYIGATNRADRRRARLAEQDERIATAAGQEREHAARAERAAALHEDFRRARRELPDTRPVAKAAEAAGRQAALLARTREDVEITQVTLDNAIAETDARTRQLRARRRRASHAHRRDRRRRDRPRRRRVRERRLRSAQRARHARARGRGPGRAGRGGRAPAPGARSRPRPPSTRPSGSRPPSTRSSARSRRPCRPTFSMSSSRSARPSAPSRTAQQAYAQHDLRARGEHDKVTAADRDVLNERQSLADAVGQLFDQATAFGEFARPDLRPLLSVGAAPGWPDPAAWPDAQRVGEDLAARLGRQPGQRRPARPTRTPSPTRSRSSGARCRPPSPRSSTRSPPRPGAAARSPRGR